MDTIRYAKHNLLISQTTCLASVLIMASACQTSSLSAAPWVSTPNGLSIANDWECPWNRNSLIQHQVSLNWNNRWFQPNIFPKISLKKTPKWAICTITDDMFIFRTRWTCIEPTHGLSAKSYSTIVHDLDGTLIDSAITVTALLNELRAEHGLSQLTINDYRPCLSIGGKAMLAAALNMSETKASSLLPLFRARYLNLPTDLHRLLWRPPHPISLAISRYPVGPMHQVKPRALTEKWRKKPH